MRGLKATVLLVVAIGGASLVPQAHALSVTPQECREGADFIGNAARSRDNGMPAARFIARLDEDLILIKSFAPAMRWFAHDDADARFLRAWVVRVFDEPALPELHGTAFLSDCMALTPGTGE